MCLIWVVCGRMGAHTEQRNLSDPAFLWCRFCVSHHKRPTLLHFPLVVFFAVSWTKWVGRRVEIAQFGFTLLRLSKSFFNVPGCCIFLSQEISLPIWSESSKINTELLCPFTKASIYSPSLGLHGLNCIQKEWIAHHYFIGFLVIIIEFECTLYSFSIE